MQALRIGAVCASVGIYAVYRQPVWERKLGHFALRHKARYAGLALRALVLFQLTETAAKYLSMRLAASSRADLFQSPIKKNSPRRGFVGFTLRPWQL